MGLGQPSGSEAPTAPALTREAQRSPRLPSHGDCVAGRGRRTYNKLAPPPAALHGAERSVYT